MFYAPYHQIMVARFKNKQYQEINILDFSPTEIVLLLTL